LGAVTRVARQLGIGPESLRNWVKQADIDHGQRPGMTTAEQRRIAELEREVRELRRANEFLLQRSGAELISGRLNGNRVATHPGPWLHGLGEPVPGPGEEQSLRN